MGSGVTLGKRQRTLTYFGDGIKANQPKEDYIDRYISYLGKDT